MQQALEEKIKALELELARHKTEIAYLHLKLNETQELSNIGSWDWDMLNNTVSWSDMMFILLGIEPNHEKPSYALALHHVHEEDKVEYEKTLEEAYNSNKPYFLMNRIRKKDGSVISVISRGQCICDEHKQVIRMIGTVQDISDH